MSGQEETKAERGRPGCLGLGDTEYCDQDWGLGWAQPGERPLLLLAGWLSAAEVLLTGLPVFGAQLLWIWRPFLSPAGSAHPLCLCLHMALEDGARGRVGTSARHFH